MSRNSDPHDALYDAIMLYTNPIWKGLHC